VTAIPDWLVPPYEGWHFDDLLALPVDVSRHIELIDGALIPMSPQSSEMTVRVDGDNGPEPDVLVVTASAYEDQERATWYDGPDVILAVEVVSPSSAARDRERKPQICAKAAIKYLWRIENEGGSPVVYTYEFDAASAAYVVTGIFHDRLRLPVPFPVDLDLAELTR
jgi:hypothetical protein